MTLDADAITKRVLLLAKQLFKQAEDQSAVRYAFTNRIMCAIGFDLSVETMLRVIVSTLEKNKPPADKFSGLIEQCDDLMARHGYGSLPNRAQILRLHSIRNDAQHKAKYPNETDVSDCRTYSRDFLTEVMRTLWGITFDELSPLDWLDDSNLRNLLCLALTEISTGDRRKGLTYTGIAFSWASRAIFDALPTGTDGLYAGQVNGLDRETVQYINAVLKDVENTSKHYSAMVATGVNPADYKRFGNATPFLSFISSSSQTKPMESTLEIHVHWNGKEPDQEVALWAYHFAVDAIIRWQQMGLSPRIHTKDQLTYLEALRLWGENVRVFL